MAIYFADYVAYVDERKRPEGFPHEVHLHEIYGQVETTEQLKEIVNERFKLMANGAGLTVLKNPQETRESGVITFDKHRFVPWHMLTHMELTVKLIPEPQRTQADISQAVPTSDVEPKELKN